MVAQITFMQPVTLYQFYNALNTELKAQFKRELKKRFAWNDVQIFNRINGITPLRNIEFEAIASIVKKNNGATLIK